MHRILFDIADIAGKDENPLRQSGLMAERYLRIQGHKVASLKDLIKKLPDENEIFFIWTVSSFTGFTFIPLIISECGIIEELTLATYSINKRILNALVKLINDKQILQVNILISDALQYQLPKVYEQLQGIISHHDNISVRYGWNHAKIACIRAGEQKFVVEGSGNWGENAQHEQYVFIRSSNIYEFRKNEINAAHGQAKSRYREVGSD